MNRPEYYPDRQFAPGVNPQQPHPPLPERYELTPEETRVLAECNSDAFKYGSLPLMFISGFGMHGAVKSGYFKPHPAMGSVPKVAGVVFCSYVLGRILYVPKCLERLKNLPNSPLAQRLKAKDGKFAYDENFGQPQPLNHFQRSDMPAPPAQGYGGDFNPAYPGVHRSNDIPQAEYHDGEKPEQGRKRSFEELRNENRLQYAQSLYSRNPPNPPPGSRDQDFGGPDPTLPPEPISDPFPPPAPESRGYGRASQTSHKPVKKNAYGDAWEE